MLTRVSPFADLEQFQRDLESVFGDFGLTRHRPSGPSLDVRDAGDHLLATADVPGALQEDIEVFVHGNELTLKGKLREAALPEGTQIVRRERRSGTFTRVLELPFEIVPDQVEARLENGVLTVTLPKAEKEQPRRIAIKVNR